jgi:hypothetical protein
MHSCLVVVVFVVVAAVEAYAYTFIILSTYVFELEKAETVLFNKSIR